MPTILGANSVSGYEISNSLRFNNIDDPHLETGDFSTASNRRTFTISTWVKRGEIVDDRTIIGYGSANNPRGLFFFGGNTLRFTDNVAGNATKEVETSAVFRDPAAWYHVMAVIDTTQGTDTNRFKIYANGELQDIGSSTLPAQNYETGYGNDGSGNGLFIGRYGDGANDAYHFDGYMADFNYVDGLALDPSYFGETDKNGVWIPKKPVVSDYGTNGFFLQFKQIGSGANSSGMGADTSGKGNHLGSSSLAARDITEDTPTNNFATLNSVDHRVEDATITEGNCKLVGRNGDDGAATSTIGVTKGKWYAEFYLFNDHKSRIGIIDQTGHDANGNNSNDGVHFDTPGGYIYTTLNGNGNDTGANSDSSGVDVTNPSADDIVGVALDADNEKVRFFLNGTALTTDGDGFTPLQRAGTGETYFFHVRDGSGSGSDEPSIGCNFGNPFPAYAISSGNTDGKYGNFEYAPPSGYYALCTKRLAEFG